MRGVPVRMVAGVLTAALTLALSWGVHAEAAGNGVVDARAVFGRFHRDRGAQRGGLVRATSLGRD